MYIQSLTCTWRTRHWIGRKYARAGGPAQVERPLRRFQWCWMWPVWKPVRTRAVTAVSCLFGPGQESAHQKWRYTGTPDGNSNICIDTHSQMIFWSFLHFFPKLGWLSLECTGPKGVVYAIFRFVREIMIGFFVFPNIFRETRKDQPLWQHDRLRHTICALACPAKSQKLRWRVDGVGWCFPRENHWSLFYSVQIITFSLFYCEHLVQLRLNSCQAQHLFALPGRVIQWLAGSSIWTIL